MAKDRQSGAEIRDFRRAVPTRLPAVASAKVGHIPDAFSLIELILVMAIITILMVLLVPAFTSMTSNNTVSSTANSIKSALENARTYAKANNTYVFVGIAEVDASRDSSANQVAGLGRVAIAAVASKDGTCHCQYSGVDWTDNYNNAANLMPVGKLQVYENLHFGVGFASWPPSAHPTSNMARYQNSVDPYNSLGTATRVIITPFSWPLGSSLTDGQYKFDKVINFDPRGVARIATANNADEVTDVMEMDFQQSHGIVTPTPPTNQDAGNHFVIQIDAPTGAVRLYRP